ncbi:MAG: response regulator [Oligoflexia bacterium]|nr:response regulator [Oligoflexia bacterium]
MNKIFIIDDEVELLKSLKQLFDHFFDGVLILNLEEKRYAYANSAICTMLGYTPKEFYAMDIMDIYPKSEHKKIDEEIMCLEEKDQQITEDITCITKYATTISADIHSKKIDFNSKKFLLYIFRDITFRKLLEREKEEMQRKVAISSRLSLLGEMASGIAHEINNPLYIINLHLENWESELARMHLENNENLRQIFTAISNSTERISKIVKGLKSYTHFDESFGQLNINEVITTSIGLLKSMYSKDLITFELNLAANSPMLMGNWGLAQQMMINFFSNAKYAMKALPQGVIKVSTTAVLDLVRVTIVDEGCGIPEEKIPNIFDPFFTTKPVGEGSGIGLNLVASIIKKMRGHIHVDSKVGKGTTFTLTFPTFERVLVLEQEKASSDAGVVKQQNNTILIVDDEPNIRNLISLYLNATGAMVEVAENGKQALLKIQAKKFDIIITDIMMPIMNGIEFIKCAHSMKLLNQSKVVFMTGVDFEVYKNARNFNIDSPADICLQKPFSKKELYQCLDSLQINMEMSHD